MTPGERLKTAHMYREAAAERINCAERLYFDGRLIEASYLAGLAAECILRGYRLMSDPEFDARHDIDALYKMAKFGDFVPPSLAAQITAALGDVIALWSNNYRFWPQWALKEKWTKQKLFYRDGKWIKGDLMKALTRQLVNSATLIVNTGVARWEISFKN